MRLPFTQLESPGRGYEVWVGGVAFEHLTSRRPEGKRQGMLAQTAGPELRLPKRTQISQNSIK